MYSVKQTWPVATAVPSCQDVRCTALPIAQTLIKRAQRLVLTLDERLKLF
jgi:hypothetical protein